MIFPDVVDNQVRALEGSTGVYLDDMRGDQGTTGSGKQPGRDRLVKVYPATTATQLADAIADGLAVANLADHDDIPRGLLT